METQPENDLKNALTRIQNSRHPYVNNTLKRLAKACATRLIKPASKEK